MSSSMVADPGLDAASLISSRRRGSEVQCVALGAEKRLLPGVLNSVPLPRVPRFVGALQLRYNGTTSVLVSSKKRIFVILRQFAISI